MSYKLTDLYAHNREVARKHPAVWSKFRWQMRGTLYGREELNDAFTFYRLGWWHAMLHVQNRAGVPEIDV